jgi:hypothetical protein
MFFPNQLTSANAVCSAAGSFGQTGEMPTRTQFVGRA